MMRSGNPRDWLRCRRTRHEHRFQSGTDSPRRFLQYEPGAEGGRLAYARRLTNTPWTLAVEFELSSVLAPATHIMRRLVLVAVVLLLVGALSAWLTARSLTKPIAELAVATQEIRVGNYSRLTRRPIVQRACMG